jgi:hypothetical protein
VAGRLVDIVQRFDVVAVQNVQAPNQGILVDLTELINGQGRYYGFAVAPHVGREPVSQYSAFLFDRARVEVDPSTVDLVGDPHRRFRREPLLASFRVRGPDPTEAFTFTLVNLHLDPQRAADECSLLYEVFRAVRDDGRGEDDVILLGDLGGDAAYFGPRGAAASLTWAVAAVPSTTRRTRLVDNILFDRQATTEFTGRAGVFDLMRELNLSMQDALEVSRHLPVWAEFGPFEGTWTGPVATRTGETPR